MEAHMCLSAANNPLACPPSQIYAQKPSGTLSLCPVGLLFPCPKDVVNVLRADVRPVHQPVEDPHLGCAASVVELGYSVVISPRANIEQPAMGLAGLAQAHNPAKSLALLVEYPWLLEDNSIVRSNELQPGPTDLSGSEKHGTSPCALELSHEFCAIVGRVLRQHWYHMNLPKVLAEPPPHMAYLAR